MLSVSLTQKVSLFQTANQFGDRDIEVIPSDAPFSNIGQNNGAREYGLTMVLDGAYQNWFLQATESPQGAARLLGGDGPLQRNILLGQIDVRLTTFCVGGMSSL